MPADLLRNYIFLRASKEGTSQEDLYKQFWQPFDDPFWRENVSQGRLNRPRSDLFMQHYLASQQTIDIPIKHLYVEYRHWIERSHPFDSIPAELEILALNRDRFRNLLEAKMGEEYSSLSQLLIAFDMGTAYPLMLLLLQEESDDCIYSVIESYIIRRAVCGLTNKNYNRVFLTLTKNLKKQGVSIGTVGRYFEELRGDAAAWPSDALFEEAWLTKPLYAILNNPRLVFILSKINACYVSSKSEDLAILNPLSIEHLMPQDWISNWPLPNGAGGLSPLQLWDTDKSDPRYMESESRNLLVHTMGNLTITTQPLNSAASNSGWPTKKAELSYSLLPINKDLLEKNIWDETMIRQRGKSLLENAKAIWPH